MSVLLLILKIIGILLLVLLGLLLTVVLLVLFCPAFYGLQCHYHKDHKEFRLRLSWLFGLLALGIDYEGSARWFLRICGIKIKHREKINNSSNYGETKEQKALEEPLREPEEAPVRREMQTQEITVEEEETQGIFSKIKGVYQSIRQRILSLAHLIRHGKQTVKKVSSLWEKEYCKEAVGYIFLQLRALLGKLKPYRFHLQLSYSMGSPDTTGQLLGILAMFPVGYKNRWSITPDFTSDNAYADADAEIRGGVCGITVLVTILRIVLDKNCRKLYNRLKR